MSQLLRAAEAGALETDDLDAALARPAGDVVRACLCFSEMGEQMAAARGEAARALATRLGWASRSFITELRKPVELQVAMGVLGEGRGATDSEDGEGATNPRITQEHGGYNGEAGPGEGVSAVHSVSIASLQSGSKASATSSSSTAAGEDAVSAVPSVGAYDDPRPSEQPAVAADALKPSVRLTAAQLAATASRPQRRQGPDGRPETVHVSATQKPDLHPLRKKAPAGPMQRAARRRRQAMEAWPGQGELLAAADLVRMSSRDDFELQAWRDALTDRIQGAERLGWRAACAKRDAMRRKARAVASDGAVAVLCRAAVQATGALVCGDVARAAACISFAGAVDEAFGSAYGPLEGVEGEGEDDKRIEMELEGALHADLEAARSECAEAEAALARLAPFCGLSAGAMTFGTSRQAETPRDEGNADGDGGALGDRQESRVGQLLAGPLRVAVS